MSIALDAFYDHAKALWQSAFQTFISSLTKHLSAAPWFNDKWMSSVEGTMSHQIRKASGVYNDTSREWIYLPSELGGLEIPHFPTDIEASFLKTFVDNYNSADWRLRSAIRHQVDSEMGLCLTSFTYLGLSEVGVCIDTIIWCQRVFQALWPVLIRLKHCEGVFL